MKNPSILNVRYDNNKIILSYKHPFGGYIKSPRLKVHGEGYVSIENNGNFLEDYGVAEQEAQLYLIKNALEKISQNPHFKEYRLSRIVGIMPDIICDKKNNHFEIQISLEGIAVLEK